MEKLFQWDQVHSVRGRRCGLLICLLNVFPSRVLFQAITNTSVFAKGYAADVEERFRT